MSDARAQAKDQLSALIKRVMADGQIEPREHEEQCRAVVSELKIPPSLLPESFKAIIAS